jgi:signal transduction histidine kinase
VNNLLLLAAGAEGKLRLRVTTFDAARAIDRLVRSWSLAAERGGLNLTFEGPTPCPVRLDETALETVVGNLISNAVKFTPTGGHVIVRLEVTETTIVVCVRDTGPGIDPEFLPRLFGRFERGDKTHVSARGSGIGLALTKELVELQGGSIEVLPHREPRGTSFVVRLPRKPASTATVAGGGLDAHREELLIPERSLMQDARDEAAATPARREATILLAEDDQALARELASILSPRYHVVVAFDGKEALAKAEEHRPDLLVTDLEMPELDGLELTRRFFNIQGTALSPVLIISAYAGLESRLAGFEAGAVDYVVKPVSAEELLARIRSQLAIRKLALRLHESEKFAAMGMLSAGLAHELRNPANAIVNVLDPLWMLVPDEHKAPASAGAKLYEVLKTASTHMRELCRNILQFSRSEEVARRPEDLRRMLHRSRVVLEASLSRVRLTEDLALDETILCASPLIEQVLVNLLDNAAYAAGPDGAVHITARREDDKAVIEVSDSGPGVPAHLHERVFDPFFTTKPIGQGTGLGLSVSRRIALNHGGDLRVVRRGERTAFRFELPL